MGSTSEPTRIGESVTLHLGDCVEVLRTLPACSVDAIVTDPPAGIAFMGKSWDTDKGGRDAWIAWMQEVAGECLRVIKPGGHALVWALPRTSHWTGMAWESAGWEPRDKIVHLFGTGFPKSLDVSKAIDKSAGAKRSKIRIPASEVRNPKSIENGHGIEGGDRPWMTKAKELGYHEKDGAEPVTEAAHQWEGWGTALKPAAEDWWLMRKPIEGTVAANVLQHGTGALNIDGCRVDGSPRATGTVNPHAESGVHGILGRDKRTDRQQRYDANLPEGRWPANVITDGSEEVVEGFPHTTSGDWNGQLTGRGSEHSGAWGKQDRPFHWKGDSGSAARFFYCAKASRADREEGCDNLPERSGADAVDREEGSAGTQSPRAGAGRTAGTVRNHHPTVKNVELMRYLCRLITPPGGTVLDPFTGSGSTGKGAVLESFAFVGIERESDYLQIAAARIAAALARAPQTAQKVNVPPVTPPAANGGTSILTGKAPKATAKAQLSLLDSLDALDALDAL
jgi:site-specific DNA-methyltransferase (adenine-specific)